MNILSTPFSGFGGYNSPAVHPAADFQLPFRDSEVAPDLGELEDVAFNSLFGIRGDGGVGRCHSFNSLFGIQRFVIHYQLRRHGWLSTPFSGFRRNRGQREGPETTFNSLFGILITREKVRPLGRQLSTPFSGFWVEDLGEVVRLDIFQLPFRDSSPSRPSRCPPPPFNSLFGIRDAEASDQGEGHLSTPFSGFRRRRRERWR